VDSIVVVLQPLMVTAVQCSAWRLKIPPVHCHVTCDMTVYRGYSCLILKQQVSTYSFQCTGVYIKFNVCHEIERFM